MHLQSCSILALQWRPRETAKEVLPVVRFLGSAPRHQLLVMSFADCSEAMSERLEDWRQRHLGKSHVDEPMGMSQSVKDHESHC